MATCPHCGREVKEPYKSWEMNPPNPKGHVLIQLFACACGRKFRTAERRGGD